MPSTLLFTYYNIFKTPGISNGCDLIYEDYCYQTFTSSVGINWNDAQSTCVVWGGDLTSIPTQRVNNFIQTIRSNTNSDYWIGLYGENENLKWIDGSGSTYRNFVSGTGSCVAMNTAGNWLKNDCNTLLNKYICRRNSDYVAGISITSLCAMIYLFSQILFTNYQLLY